ncbi:MAG: heavy metal-responsive transcriptional regulator [Acidimicrobiia bacterium]
MQIGQLATRTGVPSRTIRFYESAGVLPEPERTPAGYRDYDADAISRLLFLRAAKAAGLTLAEIAQVIALRDRGESPCAHTRQLLTAKHTDVTDRIRELTALREELDDLITAGTGFDPARCRSDDVCSLITVRDEERNDQGL